MSNQRSAIAAAGTICASAFARIQTLLASPRITGLVLFVSIWLVYLAFPTRNHYWDGIGFALNIEGVAQDHTGLALDRQAADARHIYFNPNHLLHNLFGYLIYYPVRAVWPGARALDVLVALNSFLGALTAWLVFRILFRWSRETRVSALVTLLLAFSATWWKFSTDANAYVPSVCLLAGSASMLLDGRRRPPLAAIGLLHAAAILTHQIAVLFYPAAVLAIWTHNWWRERPGRLGGAVTYSFFAAAPVLAAYLAVWFGVHGHAWSMRDFAAWLSYNGGDVYSFQGAGSSLVTSSVTLIRVFFGGRPALAWRVVPAPLLAVAVVVMFGCLVALFRTAAKTVEPPPRDRSAVPFLLAWAFVFQLFLYFWLTEYPYYRLFCLPALVCLAAFVPGFRRRLTAFVLFLGVFNFTFMIYPYSRLEATPPVRLASEATALWPKDTLVLYREATCDNWIMRYFNPHTTWVKVPAKDRQSLSAHIHRSFRGGRSVWLDTTLLGHLETNEELQDWINDHGLLAESWGLSNGRYHIQFAQLLPHLCTPADAAPTCSAD